MKIVKIVIPVLIVLGLILSLRLLGVFETPPIETSQLPDYTSQTDNIAENPTNPIIPSHTEEDKPQIPNELSNLPKIAFVSNRDGKDEIYIMNADGSNQIRLTDNKYRDFSPVWSPDGTKIAFVSWREDIMSRYDNEDIYVINFNGSDETRLTYNQNNDSSPAWSPDGKKIAYIYNNDIYIMNYDGTGQTRLTYHAVYDNTPAWSPNGKKILFTARHAGNYSFWDRNNYYLNDICTINSDGGNKTVLTNANTSYSPIWSPDGSKIAFIYYIHYDRIYDSGESVISVMNSDGSNIINLSEHAYYSDSDPVWSPDSSKIAFVSDRDGNTEIYIMNSDGTAQTNLTNNALEDFAPSWSPDGSKILFVSNRDGNKEIYIMNPDGSKQTKLTNNHADNHSPTFSPVK